MRWMLRVAYEKWRTKRRIRRHQWTAIYVGDYDTSPTWAYTIGFHASLGAPEIIVFDLPMPSANGIFQKVYDDLKAGKLVLRDGERWLPVEDERPLVWRKVHPLRLYDNDPENPWLGLAEDIGVVMAPEKGEITAFQLVLSDQAGHFPWEADYDERLRHLQRPLWDPPELAADPAV